MALVPLSAAMTYYRPKRPIAETFPVNFLNRRPDNAATAAIRTATPDLFRCGENGKVQTLATFLSVWMVSGLGWVLVL